MDSKQNGGWYVATRCDTIKSDMTFESREIMNQWVLILWYCGRPGRLRTEIESTCSLNASNFDLNLLIGHSATI